MKPSWWALPTLRDILYLIRLSYLPRKSSLRTDVKATNGIVHVINAVLLPTTLKLE
jgi:hypothetical protein